CIGGRERACEPFEPKDEVCNGVDDDCDGAIDEGCSCQDGTEIPCFDGTALELDVGVCRAGVRPCTEGGYATTCEGQVLASPEVCNGLDDDCDGEVDEECIPEGTGGAGGQGGAGGDEAPLEGGGPEETGCGGCSGGSGASAFALLVL